MKKIANLLCLTVMITPVFSQDKPMTNVKESTFEYNKIDDIKGIVLISDIDNDGKNEIVKKGTFEFEEKGKDGKKESIVWYRYNDKNKLEKHIVLSNKNLMCDRFDLGDVDNDGDLDVASGYKEGENYYVVWIENPLPKNNTLPNSWKVHKIGIQDGYMKNVKICDINNDGKPDVVTRTHEQTMIYFQESVMNWPQKKALHHESHEGMDVSDLDKDGDYDIILNGFWFETPEDPINGEFTKHIINEKWFTPVDSSWRDNNASIKVADVNLDGIDDVLLSHSELKGFPIALYTVSSLEDLKNDKWTEIIVNEKYDFCQTLDVADADNDGDMDILAAKFERQSESHNPQWSNFPPFPVSVFYNVGRAGLSWKEQVIENKEGMYDGIFGDIDNDGDMDILGECSYFKGPLRSFINKTSGKKK